MNVATPSRHLAQFVGSDEPRLIQNLGRYLTDGVVRGGGLVIVTTDERRAALLRELQDCGISPAGAIRAGHCLIAETHETLSSLYEGSDLSYERFDQVIGEAIREMQSRVGSAGVRAYGDMVGALWERTDYVRALELEQYWNKLQEDRPFDLYCAYPIDGRGAVSEAVDAVLHAHTQMV